MFYKLQSLVYRSEILTEENILKELCFFINALPDWVEKKSKWFIANHNEKMVAIDNCMATQKGYDHVRSEIVKDDIFNIVLADEKEDDSALTISFRNTPVVSNQRYLLSLTIKSLERGSDLDVFVEFVKRVIKLKAWGFKYIIVDTEQYKRKQRCAFHDRLSVGWMLYLPTKIERMDVPSAHSVVNIEGGLGSIVVSKQFFDGKEPSDIIVANNVEIELASKGLLPLIKGL